MRCVLEEELCPEAPVAKIAPRESLAASVVLMLVLTVVQRGFGFVREILFCRWLSPDDLGQWNLAFGFLNLAAPLAVLGIPGSFGRYVEYYRQRGQLRSYLTRTTLVSATTATLFVGSIVAFPRWYAQLIFGSAEQTPMILPVAAALAMLLMNNFLMSLFIGMHWSRVVNVLQFVFSLLFAGVSIFLLAQWQCVPQAVTWGFAVAYGATTLVAVSRMRLVWHADGLEHEPAGTQRDFWSKMIPFVGALWLANLLTNLFDYADREMIVHYSSLSLTEANIQVGNYHSSRILPMMFAAVAALFSEMVLPHLSRDWESGRKEAVSDRVNRTLKLVALLLLVAFWGIELFSPIFFNWALSGKYAGGLAVLPWTLAYGTWFGMNSLAQNYLWCAERAGLSSLARFLGLVANIALNLVLLPRYGLHGAVWATALANLLALTLMLLFSRPLGMTVQRGTWILALAPAALGLGVVLCGAVLLVLLAVSYRTEWIFSAAERREASKLVNQFWRKLRPATVSH